MSDKHVALVTGASRGIGRGIAVELSQNGFLVVVNYCDNLSAAEETLAEITSAGGQGDLCQADIAAPSHRDLLTEYVLERFGRIDLLVNNAGVAPLVRNDILDVDQQSYDRVMGINLKGAFFLTQGVAKHMINQIKSGTIENPKIVNIGSISAYSVSVNRAEYCMSKAGLSMMTQLYAVRLAEEGIGVFEVCPGVVKTDMTDQAVVETYDKRIAAGMTPIRRWGEPQDVGKAVAAIAAGHFPFSTGQSFPSRIMHLSSTSACTASKVLIE